MPLIADVVAHREDFRLDASLEVGDGQTLALVGPNAAGKSTLLDAIAGLLPLDRGTIELDGEPIHDLPPHLRRIGLAPQHALLFPRMTVLENVAFGRRAKGAKPGPAREAARDTLGWIAPGVDASDRPTALSGGERQKVALARAVASDPRVLLLDEPLSAVDVSARADLRRTLREAIARFDGPCVFVAHDPTDALTLADTVAILEAGRITQSGTPEEIRRAPGTRYAADLVGINLFVGTLEPADPGAGLLVTDRGMLTVAWPAGLARKAYTDVVATLRPVEVSVHLERPEGSARNVVEGTISEVVVHGERARIRVESAPPLVAEVTLGSIDRLDLRRGARVFASCKAVELRLRVEGVEPDTLET